MRDLIAGELRGPSVIKDEEPLGYDYIPKELPGREEDLKHLARLFRPILTGAGGQHITITGPVGSGKTVLSKYFAGEFAKVAQEQHRVNVRWVHINCRRRSTESAALLAILQHFDSRFPDRGFSMDEMLDNLRKQLARTNAHLVVILDEADVLLKKSGSNLVYNLTRFYEETGPAKGVGVSLILVSQQNVRPFMDEAARSTFKRGGGLELGRYDVDRLLPIVHQRVELAFHKNAFPEELEELVAEIAADEGDARFAIELLKNAGGLADEQGKSEVEAEHVRGAKALAHPFIDRVKLGDLDLHKQLTLLAIARVLKKGGAYAITGEVEGVYALVCEEVDERPRAHTQFWTYLKDLESLGFIQAKRSGKGVMGTTTLISLPDIPASELEREVLALVHGEPDA